MKHGSLGWLERDGGGATLPCVLRAARAASSMQRRTSAWRSLRASGTKKRKRGVTWASSRYWDSLFRARAIPHLEERGGAER